MGPMLSSGRPRALLVDDDPATRVTLRAVLEDQHVAVLEAEDGRAALEHLAHADVHIVITDLRMPGMDGLELLSSMRDWQNPPRVIVVTGHGSESRAVEAMKVGAYDYLTKPCDVDHLLAVVRRAVESATLQSENERLAGELTFSRYMLFDSEPMRRLAVMARRVAGSPTTVLIRGETGTGKERLAECIVAASARADRPFLRVNCATLGDDLTASTLFGHTRGAFTGAEESRPGLLREADGGTLLLDQVSELPVAVQASLLRVLQEGEVRPVGSEEAEKVDVRFIATTSRDLAEAVSVGAFREDLFYRLRVVELEVPPLRDRPEEIPHLIDHFIDLYGRRYGLNRLRAPAALYDSFVARKWPGNVRELENAVDRLVALSNDGRIDMSVLADWDGAAPRRRATLREKLAAYERGILLNALREADDNRSEAAKLLGVSRATLHSKLNKHGIEKRYG